jgi:plasmid stability protein
MIRNIDEALMRRVKARAAADGQTLHDVLIGLLQAYVDGA